MKRISFQERRINALVEACEAIVRDFEDEDDPLIVPASSCVHIPRHTDLCPYWLAKLALAYGEEKDEENIEVEDKGY